MGSLILLVVAAIWIAVLVPPLLRSRLENRPNSSVSDFRAQLSSLQKTVPTTRSVSMRGMARPLAPSAMARPAAPDRPLRSGVTLASGGSTRSPQQQAALRPVKPEPVRTGDPALRARVGDGPTRSHGRPVAMTADRDLVKRRRANILFVLGVVTACSVFLAVTTKSAGLAYVAAAASVSLVGYLFMLAQQANTARPAARDRRVEPAARRQSTDRAAPRRREHAAASAGRQYRGARAEQPVRREVEEWDEELDERPVRSNRREPGRGEPARPDANRHERRAQPAARSSRDELAHRRETRAPRSWGDDPRPSGVVYGDPLFSSREQPAVRRERPARRRQAEWSPAV